MRPALPEQHRAPAGTSTGPRIEAVDVVFDYPGRKSGLRALDGLTLDIGPSESVAIVGPSGCGKSTFVRVLAGLVEPTSGTVTIGRAAPAEVAAAHQLGIALQEHALLPWLSARDNVCLPFHLAGRAVDHGKADDLLELVGLADFRDTRPRALSGGMRQRVAIARALALDPVLVLLDEPFGSLDAVTRRRLNLEMQTRVLPSIDATAVLVTHSLDEAVLFADRVVVLTSRPATLSYAVAVDLPRPRTAEMVRSRDFHDVVDDLGARLDELHEGIL